MPQAKDKAFFLDAIQKLRTCTPEQKPLWGSMSPQHMVEHVVGSWRISNGRARVPAMLSGEELEKRRLFLFSDKEYKQNIANPIFAKGEPPLRKPSLDVAIDQLEDEMNAFFEYHEAHPDAIETHPVFGDLDFDGWMLFQTKHMGHHMRQFGLL